MKTTSSASVSVEPSDVPLACIPGAIAADARTVHFDRGDVGVMSSVD